jgi:hypothetical protein
MQIRPLAILLLATSAAPALWSDVTLRSRNTMRFGAAMPGPVAERTRNGTESALPDTTVRYRKGSREFLKSGKFACLMDFDKQTITILDAEQKRFVTVAMKDYVDKVEGALPALPPEYRTAQEAAKTTLSTRKTGRTDVMQGVPVEETEMVVSVDLPVPQADGEMRSQTLVKMTMQVWMAKSVKVSRLPAVRELAAHSWQDARFSQSIDPTNILAMTFGAMPGLGEGLSRMFQEVEKSGSVVLKTHLEASMPMAASFLQQMRKEQENSLRDGLDPNAPFGVVDCEVVEVSTSPVDDAVFQLPADYTAAAFEDVIKSVAPSFPKS